jgi:hypothetical protein
MTMVEARSTQGIQPRRPTPKAGPHGDTNTGKYTFLDDPSEAFDNGVEVTQITGITNSGEITGFYSDANGVFHAFVANPGMM